MRVFLWFSIVSFLLMSLVPVAANAQGTIAGLSANPGNPAVNQDTVITVLGSGFCKKLEVDFGDGNTEILTDVDFDNSTNVTASTYNYSPAATYVVKATPVKQCVAAGNAPFKSIDLIVGVGTIKPGKVSARDSLCAILENCGRAQASANTSRIVALPPHLEGVLPFSVIEPGGEVVVTGQNFGRTMGELHLYLETDKKDLKLTPDVWANRAIRAKIPYATYGVVDQPAEFYVKTAGGASNRVGPVSFTARRGVQLLPRSDVVYDDCSCEATCNTCDASNVRGSCPHDCFSLTEPDGALAGFHYAVCGIGTDSDQDTYDITANFKNGWALDHATIHNKVEPGEGSASVSLNKGAKRVKVDWSVTQCDALAYKVNVIIKGPIGTDYK